MEEQKKEKEGAAKVIDIKAAKVAKGNGGQKTEPSGCDLMRADAFALFENKEPVERMMSRFLMEILRNGSIQEEWINLETRMGEIKLLRFLSMMDSVNRKVTVKNLGVPNEVVEWLLFLDEKYCSFFKEDFLKLLLHQEKAKLGVKNDWEEIEWGTYIKKEDHPLIEMKMSFDDGVVVRSVDCAWSFLRFAAAITEVVGDFLNGNLKHLNNNQKKAIREALSSFSIAAESVGKHLDEPNRS